MDTIEQPATWDTITQHLQRAEAITWDGCHKIYVLMDRAQVEFMREVGYDPIITGDHASPTEMATYLRNWFNASCWLRFVYAVHTVDGDPNEIGGFTSLIEQFDPAFSGDDMPAGGRDE